MGFWYFFDFRFESLNAFSFRVENMTSFIVTHYFLLNSTQILFIWLLYFLGFHMTCLIFNPETSRQAWPESRRIKSPVIITWPPQFQNFHTEMKNL